MKTRDPYQRESQQIDSFASATDYIPLWEMFAVLEHLGCYSGKWWTNPELLKVRTDLAKLAGGYPAKFRELEDLLAFATSLSERTRT